MDSNSPDKLNIPVYVISINKNVSFDFNTYFSNVTIYPAIDTRNKSAKELLLNGTISWRAYNDLTAGRKDHFGFAGIGGIGLYLTYREILNKNKYCNQNILICEQDCLITNTTEFTRKIQKLEMNKTFDCAVFGADFDNNLNNGNDFIYYKNNFALTQSIIWSPKGINNVLEPINSTIEIQLDSFFSYLCIYSILNLLMETEHTTKQQSHPSLLNNDAECKLCDIPAKEMKERFGTPGSPRTPGSTSIRCIIIILLILLLFIIRTKIKKNVN